MSARLAALAVIVLASAAPRQEAFRVVDQDGRAVDFYREVVGGRLAAINFVFTSCTAVCPVLGANFAAVQRQLPDAGLDDVALVSISVDPETDTPARLKTWRDRRGGKPGWTLVTGGPREIRALLDHLGAASPTPAAHTSSMLIGRRGAWRRLDGLAAPREVIARLRDERDAGASIFMTGARADRPIPASLGTGLELPAAEAACANCHGRDGRGRAEAGRAAPDIRWARLTAPYGVSRPYGRTTDPYTEATLLRALTQGVDAAGRPLDAAMPRYRLDAADAAALFSHLRSLDDRAEPGVSDTALTIGLMGAGATAIPGVHIFGRGVEWKPLSPAALKQDAASVLAIAAVVDARQLTTLESLAADGVPIVATVIGEPPVRHPSRGNLVVLTPTRETHARRLVDLIVKLPGASPDDIAIAGGDGEWRETADAVRDQLRQWGSNRAPVPGSRAKHVLHLGPFSEIAQTAAGRPGAHVYAIGDPRPDVRGVRFARAAEDGASPARLLAEVLRQAGRDVTREALVERLARLARARTGVSTSVRLCYPPGSDSDDPC